MVLVPLLVATLPVAAAAPLSDLAAGHQSFRAGEYRKAARTLERLPEKLPRVRDHVLYIAAESEFYAGRLARARALFERLAAEKTSRFAPLAPWRAADCLWAEGKKTDAAAAYKRLLPSPPPGVDAVVARFRLAELAAPEDAPALFREIHADSPAHPLAAEAARRAGPASAGASPLAIEPRARLRRAALLAEGKHYLEAIDELLALPADLPEKLQIERDLQLGMARFHTRRQYPEAAATLLAVAPRLEGERAAHAHFHGARALVRSRREDEAIAACLQVVERYPKSRWAAEAQFVVGWLEFNRGRYRESLAGLRATIDRFGRSAYANDAAWYLALAHHFLAQPREALAALEDYVRLSRGDADVARRAAYWRGRFQLAAGDREAARASWRELVKREPLAYYGLLSRARLRQLGEKVGIELPRPEDVLPAPPRKALQEPSLLRAQELDRAGLTIEAGIELQRSEEALQEKLGREASLALLLAHYPRYQAFRRAYQLAATRGGTALQAAPTGDAKVLWESAHPRAWRELVEKQAKTAGTPALFVWSIMHKESGFGPHVVSRADARGLLQLIPPLGRELARRLRMPFFPDDLYRPEVNIRLGVVHLGQLVKKFRGQVFLAAGAYNGGLAAMTRWLDHHGKKPLDEFVELVGFKDTREYIKRVSALYARYVYLYTGKPWDLPLTINPAYLKKAVVSVPAPPDSDDD